MVSSVVYTFVICFSFDTYQYAAPTNTAHHTAKQTNMLQSNPLKNNSMLGVAIFPWDVFKMKLAVLP